MPLARLTAAQLRRYVESESNRLGYMAEAREWARRGEAGMADQCERLADKYAAVRERAVTSRR
jgi:hypothetical protein